MKEKIEKILQAAGVSYELIPLPKDIAMDIDVHMKFHGKNLQQAMPNMVFKTEKGLVVAQRRGDSVIDSKKLRKLLGVQRLSLASREDLETFGLKPGIVPPMSFDVPFYMDKKVLENEEIYTGSGDVRFALRINPQDLVKLNKAVVGDFTYIKKIVNGND